MKVLNGFFFIIGEGFHLSVKDRLLPTRPGNTQIGNLIPRRSATKPSDRPDLCQWNGKPLDVLMRYRRWLRQDGAAHVGTIHGPQHGDVSAG